jgi:hypothetical protein
MLENSIIREAFQQGNLLHPTPFTPNITIHPNYFTICYKCQSTRFNYLSNSIYPRTFECS